MDQHTRIARITGWISIAPLLGLPLVAWIWSPEWLTRLLVGWGALLLAFWAGSLWMRHVDEEPRRSWMLIASVALVLCGWLAISMPFHWAMFWLAALFSAYLFIDEPWEAQGRSGWYRRMRLLLTVLAIAILALSGLIRITGGH